VRQEMMQYLDLASAVDRLHQYKEYLLAYANVQTISGTMEAA
jgi:hypothetical protein